MHTEEICVENGSEERLLHNDLGQDRENLARIVEVVAEECKPTEAR